MLRSIQVALARTFKEYGGNMDGTRKAAMIQLPNGNFIYPGRLASVNASRTGIPPNLWVVLDCVTTENETEVEHIHCETYEQTDAVGRVFAATMGRYFPQVSVSFVEETHAA